MMGMEKKQFYKKLKSVLFYVQIAIEFYTIKKILGSTKKSNFDIKNH